MVRICKPHSGMCDRFVVDVSFRRCNRSGCEQANWLKSRTTSLNVSSPVTPISESFISSFKRPSRNLKRVLYELKYIIYTYSYIILTKWQCQHSLLLRQSTKVLFHFHLLCADQHDVLEVNKLVQCVLNNRIFIRL